MATPRRCRDPLRRCRDPSAASTRPLCGVDDAPSPRSYDIVLITRFDSPEALSVYQTHLHHQQVLEFLSEVVESAVKVDYAG